MRIRFHLHLPFKQQIGVFAVLWNGRINGSACTHTPPPQHTDTSTFNTHMHIFRCKHIKLRLLPLGGTRSKDPFQICPLTIFSQDNHMCWVSLPHGFSGALPGTVFTSQLGRRNPVSSPGLESIDPSCPLAPVPPMGTVNYMGPALISLHVFLSTLDSVAFLDLSVHLQGSGLGRGTGGLMEFVPLGSWGPWVSGGSSGSELGETETKGVSNSISPASATFAKPAWGCSKPPHPPCCQQGPFCYISLKLAFMNFRHHAKSLSLIFYFQSNPMMLILSSFFTNLEIKAYRDELLCPRSPDLEA